MKNITTFNLEELNKFKIIYVLVSGGFDSTYLYELIRERFPEKMISVNCFNPYEWNKTLKQIEKEDKNFIKIMPERYKDVIKESFLKLPEAYIIKKEGRYHKKIFPCCHVLKHKSFKKDSRFKEEGAVIVSGIKRGDGRQRRWFLWKMANGTFKHLEKPIPTFFHRHKSREMYCYPFRDYMKRELPDDIKDVLWSKYPHLEHSGCSLCPVVVLFNIYNALCYERSLLYAKKLGVLDNKRIDDFI